MAIRSYRDLEAWQVSMELALNVYGLAARLPPHERYEMAGQMRRAALSVPSNVAEGHGTRMPGRFKHHVRISLGSVAELGTCLELGHRLSYWDGSTVSKMEAELARTTQLLHGLQRSIRLDFATKAVMGLAVLTWLIVTI